MDKNNPNHPWYWWHHRKQRNVGLWRAIYWDLKQRWRRYWINYWYSRNKCPICKEPIEWEDEGGTLEHPGSLPYPVHVDEAQDDKCEGVC